MKEILKEGFEKLNIEVSEKQIDMLKDVMEISEDEIISWYLDNIDMMDIVAEFKLKIAEKLGGEKKNELI